MEIDVTEGEETGVTAPAVSLEISPETAEQAEELLSEFAEDAGLETALIVDRGGALVAGISSEEDVTVDVISGLVAGASSAMRALVDQLGDTGEIESLHQGGKRLLYIREIVNRFVLVGVSDASFPPGIVREKAAQLQPKLADLLEDVKPLDPPEPVVSEKPKSLRAVAAERAAARGKVEILQKGSSPAESADEENSGSDAGEDILGEAGSADELDPADAAEPEPVPPEDGTEEERSTPEPVEVLEPLDLGGPEIVIEHSSVDEDENGGSPFELEDEEEFTEEKEDVVESEVESAGPVFELENEGGEPVAAVESSVFGRDGEEGPADGAPASEENGETSETIFEYDEAEDEEDVDGEEEIAGSGPDDSGERDGRETDGEEAESHNSGPFYF